MKNLLRLLLCFIVCGNCIAQTQEELHPILAAARAESYFAKQVNWQELNKQFTARIGNGKDQDSLKTGLTFLLNSLKDKHGVFRRAKDYRPVAWFTAYDSLVDQDNRPRDPDFINRVINDLDARFSYKQLDGQTGYLRIVGIGPQQDLIQEGQNMRNAIAELNASGVKHWVIDLRFNGGGNMNPMIAGMAPLLSEGHIGGSFNAEGAVFQNFEIKGGQFIDTERLVDSTATKIQLDHEPRIAVLLSRYTVSSGEIVATVFKGQDNTRFFGEDSGGMTTVTGFNPVTEDLYMCISAAIYADRLGNSYPINIPVDEAIKMDLDTLNSQDAILEAALKWLKK